MSLPNLLVIGAMKCGTTSLHNYLNQHPDIYMSNQKELDFFVEEKNWNKGIDWYKDQFRVIQSVRGESSQNYSKTHMFGGVPERIKKILGDDLKLIYVIRKPLDRILSHYVENLESNESDGDLNKALVKEGNKYLETTLYGKQLNRYVEVFGGSSIKIKVIELESLHQERIKVMNELFTFLEVRALAADLELGASLNNREDKLLKHPVYHFLGRLSASGMGRILNSGVKEKIKNLKVFNRNIPDMVIEKETIDSIKNAINQDLDLLGSLVSGQFDHYKL